MSKIQLPFAGVNVDISKDGNPLNLWGMGWDGLLLAGWLQQVGRRSTLKYDGMQLKWQMDNDEQVLRRDEALGFEKVAANRWCDAEQRSGHGLTPHQR